MRLFRDYSIQEETPPSSPALKSGIELQTGFFLFWFSTGRTRHELMTGHTPVPSPLSSPTRKTNCCVGMIGTCIHEALGFEFRSQMVRLLSFHYSLNIHNWAVPRNMAFLPASIQLPTSIHSSLHPFS
jgi:hypothetical protein